MMRPTFAALVATTCVALSACSSQQLRRSPPGREAPLARADASASPTTQAAQPSGDVVPERLLVKRAWLALEADDMDRVVAQATRIAKEHEGYVERSATYGERSVTLTLRVAADQLAATLDEIEKLGSVEERSVSAEDVTAEVADLDAREKNLRAVRDRLRALLDRATAVPDVVAVEKELKTVQGDLDALQARLKVLRSTAALSQVELTAERPRLLGPLGWVGYGLWWGFSKLFVIR